MATKSVGDSDFDSAVLQSGNHAEIAKWRRAEAEKLTQERRPDLWAKLRG